MGSTNVATLSQSLASTKLFGQQLDVSRQGAADKLRQRRAVRSACNSNRMQCSLCARVMQAGSGRGSDSSPRIHARRNIKENGAWKGLSMRRRKVSMPRSTLQDAERQTESGREPEEVEKIKKGLLGRPQALKLVDKYLESDDERSAVAVARALVGIEGGLRAFGTAQQVPQRQYTLQDLRLNKIEPVRFLSPTDSTLNKVRTTAQAALLSGIGSLYYFGHWDMTQLLGLVVGLLFVGSVDQVSTLFV